MRTPRLPVVFLPHGGGPWPFVELGLGNEAELNALALYLRGVPSGLGVGPKALLVVSAHWEAATLSVTGDENPPLLYDYYGFPPASYELTWPAPGSSWLVQRAENLLGLAGFEVTAVTGRGLDHGTFIPLKVAFPDAQLPTVQLSLKRGLDAAEHVAIGRALEPLRDEGVLIVGSGMSFHNLRAFGTAQASRLSEEFDAWLRDAATAGPEERDRRLGRWLDAPAARFAHPREEHLLPLMVVAGAANRDRGRVAYGGTFMGARLSAFHFG